MKSRGRTDKIASMDYLANIIKYGEIRNKSATNYHDKNSNAIFHYLKSKITVDGILYDVTVDLKEIDRTIFYIHGLNINKNAVHHGQNLGSKSALTGAQQYSVSIEQKTNNVNSNSNQFLKYIPDKLLSEEQIESKKMLYWKLMIK